MAEENEKARVGVAGSGFISRGLLHLLERRADLRVSRVLTRSDPARRGDFPWKDILTRSLGELLDSSDIVVECSGDPIHAHTVVDRVTREGLPVVTMDAEFQVTTGSYFARGGLITEAEGDQPGCLAALKEDAIQMGFRPLVYGNIKGFLNQRPSLEDMQYWAQRQGISLDKTVEFTDGTKLQMEQALVANGLDAEIATEGLVGPSTDDLTEASAVLAGHATRLGCPVSDYVLSRRLPPGVFIVAEHDREQQPFLKYYKMGDGPHYLLTRNFHLCHLEALKTVRRVLAGGSPLLTNSAVPRIGVAAVVKRPLQAGTVIERGIGGFDVRGVAVRIADRGDHVPIGLLSGAVLKHSLDPDQMVTFSDVDVPESPALSAWQSIRRGATRLAGLLPGS
ncbi:MAG: SAF domain-containing protein [Chloroflexota bacterium]